jgi:hypothetical protein
MQPAKACHDRTDNNGKCRRFHRNHGETLRRLPEALENQVAYLKAGDYSHNCILLRHVCHFFRRDIRDWQIVVHNKSMDCLHSGGKRGAIRRHYLDERHRCRRRICAASSFEDSLRRRMVSIQRARALKLDVYSLQRPFRGQNRLPAATVRPSCTSERKGQPSSRAGFSQVSIHKWHLCRAHANNPLLSRWRTWKNHKHPRLASSKEVVQPSSYTTRYQNGIKTMT